MGNELEPGASDEYRADVAPGLVVGSGRDTITESVRAEWDTEETDTRR